MEAANSLAQSQRDIAGLEAILVRPSTGGWSIVGTLQAASWTLIALIGSVAVTVLATILAFLRRATLALSAYQCRKLAYYPFC